MHDSHSEWPARAETVARDVLAKHAADVDKQARWPAESIDALRAGGFLGLTVPASHGGAAQGPRVFANVVAKLAEGGASTAMIYLMHLVAPQSVAEANEFGKRDPVLTDIAAGKHLSTLAFSERGSRSHFWAPVSQATAYADGYHITADKSFVTGAGYVDSYVV